MNRYQETFDTWNKIAALYQDKFMKMNLYNKSYDFVCNSIKTFNAEILEIGCGPGNITKYLLSERPDFRIYGIDVAPNMIALAKKNNPTAMFEVMDCRQIKGLRKKFDGVICGFCLPYLSQADSEKLIKDSYNLLAENGLIYLSFVEGNPKNAGFQTGSSGDRVYFYYHSLDEMKARLSDHQFQEIEVFQVGYKKSDSEEEIHTILTARKNATA